MFVDLRNKATGLRIDQFSPPIAVLGIRKVGLLLGTGERHVKQAPLFFQFAPGIHAHGRGEQVFFHANDIDIGKLQALGQVNGHKGHAVVVALLLVHVGCQGHVFQELAQVAPGVGQLLLPFHEIFDPVEQLFDVLHPGNALRGAVFLEFQQQPRLAGHLFGQHEGVSLLVQDLETADHVRKIGQFPARPAMKAQGLHLQVFDKLENSAAALVGRDGELVDRGIADAACRKIDHPLQGFLIARVHHQPQIGQYIFDLLALVKGQPSVDPVRDIPFSQGVLDGPRLRIGAVQNGKMPVGELLLHLMLKNGRGHEPPFLGIGGAAVQFDGGAFLIGGPDHLFQLLLVSRNDAVGGVYDIPGGTVVLFEAVYGHIVVIALEIQNIADIGPPERIDALGIVSHHANILVSVCKGPHDQVLRMVGILVLIYQNVPEALLVFHEHLRKAGQQFVGAEQQVVKIHGARFEASVYVLLVDFPGTGPLGHGICLLQFGVLEIGPHRDQAVLVRGDALLDLLVFVNVFVEAHFLDDGSDQPLGVLGVVNGEIAGEAELVAVEAQQPGKDGMERAHPQVFSL